MLAMGSKVSKQSSRLEPPADQVTACAPDARASENESKFAACPSIRCSTAVPAQARGVYAITRHPMMWAFTLWGASHIAIYPVPAKIIVAGAIIILALVGAALQDRKKAALQPDAWPDWERKTSYWPFGAIVSGKARIGGFGMHALAGGLVLWLAATWAHIPLAGWPAGIWRWL
jgi:uncharacterized membrane protein